MSADLIIDAHVHTYPDATVGQQAMQGAGRSGCSGTIEEILSTMARAGISYSAMANMTPVYDMKMANMDKLPASMGHEEKKAAEKDINQKMISRMQRRNLWTCQVARENRGLIPFISIDLLQSPPEMEAEIESAVKEHGAKGIKLHPVSSRAFPYDRGFWPAYARAQELGIPVLFHSGEAELAGYADAQYARPAHFAEVLRSFPKLALILAHLGKGFTGESVALAQKYQNVYFDASAIISASKAEGGLSDAELVALIEKLGTDRVFFGSDWPWFPQAPAIERIKSLKLAEEEKQGILGRNAARVLKIA